MSVRSLSQSAISNQRRNEHHNAGGGHGNAASSGADDEARDADHGCQQFFVSGHTSEPAADYGEAETVWHPRALTVEELRARFREDTVLQRHVPPGNLVDRQGRRLTDFDIDEQKERQRMPEPMPTAWLSPVKPPPSSSVMRHFGSAILGLTIGLAIAVPAVLWHKGRFDPLAMAGLTAADFGLAMAAPMSATFARSPDRETETSRVVVAQAPRTFPVDVTSPVAPASVTDIAVPTAESASTMAVLQQEAPVAAKPEPPRGEVLLDDARRLIGEGDFPSARRMLEDSELVTTPAARFLLAETYDPNFLAARGIRSVRAEVPRAIELYREALDGGVAAARQRLTALRP